MLGGGCTPWVKGMGGCTIFSAAAFFYWVIVMERLAVWAMPVEGSVAVTGMM
jgi:hypothetical protein